MSEIPDSQLAILLFIPIGGLILWMMDQHEEEHTTGHVAGREAYYLRYNKDEIMKGLLASEGHFRNVQGKGLDDKGFMQCAVKHLSECESAADEAVCHSVIVADAETSEHFGTLRDKIQGLRHDLQDGKVNPTQGIERVREIRRKFESFNPDFDISACKACEVQP